MIDTSAIAAILFKEPKRAGFNQKIRADDARLIPAATLMETAILVEARRLGCLKLDFFVYEAGHRCL